MKSQDYAKKIHIPRPEDPLLRHIRKCREDWERWVYRLIAEPSSNEVTGDTKEVEDA